MIEDEQIYNGSKFRGLVNNEILEIVGSELNMYGVEYVTVKDSKGRKNVTTKDRFKHLLLTHINDR